MKLNFLLNALGVLIGLSVLAAFLMPPNWNGRSRHNARRASCQSNLKQIGMALQLYSADYEELLPPRPTSRDSNSSNWVDLISPYMKSKQVFRCPADENFSNSEHSEEVTSYFFNLNAGGTKAAQKGDTSQIILLGEGQAASGDYACRNLDVCIGRNDEGRVGSVPEEAPTRHLDGSNYGFLDGHVKWLKPETVREWPGKNIEASFKLR